MKPKTKKKEAKSTFWNKAQVGEIFFELYVIKYLSSEYIFESSQNSVRNETMF